MSGQVLGLQLIFPQKHSTLSTPFHRLHSVPFQPPRNHHRKFNDDVLCPCLSTLLPLSISKLSNNASCLHMAAILPHILSNNDCLTFIQLVHLWTIFDQTRMSDGRPESHCHQSCLTRQAIHRCQFMIAIQNPFLPHYHNHSPTQFLSPQLIFPLRDNALGPPIHLLHFVLFRLLRNDCQKLNHDVLGLHTLAHLPSSLSNDGLHLMFIQLTPLQTSYNPTKVTSGCPESHRCQPWLTCQALHYHQCITFLCFRLPLHHTTFTNTMLPFTWALLLPFPQNDNWPPYHLPFVDDNSQDHKRPLPWLTKEIIYHPLQLLPQLIAF